MEIIVKIKWNSYKERFEKYINNRYILYLPLKEESDSISLLIMSLSKNLGIPKSKISFKKFDYNKNAVFELF